jgi:hypothetical protein
MSYSPTPDIEEKFVANKNDYLFDEHQKEILRRQHLTDLGRLNEEYTPPHQEYTRTLAGEANVMPILPPTISESEQTDEYDPYKEFKRIHGMKGRKTRYNIYYVNIDSKNRETQTTVQTDDTKNLSEDPLHFSSNTSTNEYLLWIDIPKHNFQQNDLITLSGLEKKTTILNTYTFDVTGKGEPSVVFRSGYQNIKIMSNPNITPTTGSTITLEEVKKINTSSMLVNISGFIGYPIASFYGNIPINTINTVHQVLLYNPENSDDYSPTLSYFFISLVQPFSGSINPASYNFSMVFNSYGIIPYNTINAQYPIDTTSSSGYHTVYSTQPNSVSIKYTQNPYFKTHFGGTNIYTGKVTSFQNGYPDPNNYQISLNDTFQNVIMVRFISTTFPNITDTFVKNSNYQNNKFYWQNADDGDIVYSVELEVGKYDITTLCSTLESKIYDTLKPTTMGNYNNHNYINFSMDPNTNIIVIKSYKEGILRNPIVKIDPPIDESGTTADTYTLTIYHPSHGLLSSNIGIKISFSGFIECMGLSATQLDGEHAVTKIVDVDNYQIQLSNINIGVIKTDSKGGNAVIVHVPNLFRILFNYSDTMGEVLGFRNVGNDDAITYYQSTITNQDPYNTEPTYTSSGIQIKYHNNSFKLTKFDYVLMACKEFTNIEQFGEEKIQNVFGKIYFKDPTKVFANDTFARTPMILNDPIEFSKLSISFYYPDGELFDFHGLDHSFVLSITTIDDLPKGTAIVSFTNRE